MRQILLLALFAANQTNLDPIRPQNFRQPTKRELATCPDLRWIDYAALGKAVGGQVPAMATGGEAAHAKVRGDIAFPHPTDATLVISTVIGSGETQEVPTSTSSVIWRDAAGAWHFDRVDREDASKVRHHYTGLLASDLAQPVDQALADPCFALEPDYLPFNPPARKGFAPDYCYSYITSVVLLRSATATRTMLQCAARKNYRTIANAAMYARSGPLGQ